MVLLSIKPKYVEKIISGQKKYEFRKTIFNLDEEIVVIYATSPIKKIIGYFHIEEVINDHPKKIWSKCRELSGISKSSFFEYFTDRNYGYAIRIGKLHLFDEPLEPTSIMPGFIAPQSFCYIDRESNQSDYFF